MPLSNRWWGQHVTRVTPNPRTPTEASRKTWQADGHHRRGFLHLTQWTSLHFDQTRLCSCWNRKWKGEPRRFAGVLFPFVSVEFERSVFYKELTRQLSLRVDRLRLAGQHANSVNISATQYRDILDLNTCTFLNVLNINWGHLLHIVPLHVYVKRTEIILCV